MKSAGPCHRSLSNWTPYRSLACALLIASSSICSTAAIAQEPKKPAWFSFPFGKNNSAKLDPLPSEEPSREPFQTNAKSRNATNARSNTEAARPEPQLIWADPQSPNADGPGDGYFRRVMELPEVERCFAEIQSAAGIEVYMNGQRVRPTSQGNGKQRIEFQKAVRPGRNVLAIAVQSPGMSQPGVAVEFYFKPTQGNWRLVVSDNEWRASKGAPRNWQMLGFNDEAWMPAIVTASRPQASFVSCGNVIQKL